MTPPSFENKINYGNIIQIVIILVAILSAYFGLQAQASENAQKISDMEKDNRVLWRERLPQIERSQQLILQKLEQINEKLEE